MRGLRVARSVRVLSVAALTLVLPAARAGAQVDGVAVEADGSIVLLNSWENAIFRIDPATGALHTVSSGTVGSGLPLARAQELAVESDGSLLVTVAPGGQLAVLRVHPSSGDRTSARPEASPSRPMGRWWPTTPLTTRFAYPCARTRPAPFASAPRGP